MEILPSTIVDGASLFHIPVARNILRRARNTRMHQQNRKKLGYRVIRAAEAAFADQKHVSSVDVLVGIGWLDPGAVARWQRGQIEYLEEVVQTNLSRISEVMKLFRSWATAKGLTPSETHYVARTPRGRRCASARAEIRRSKWRSDDRNTVPHPLDFGRAFREKAGALGGKSEPRARASGDPATE
jgi:hypothetical protein